MKNLLLLLSFSLIAWMSGLGQSTSELERSFLFEKESSESEFIVEVEPNTTGLMFALKSTINQGDLKVSLISPSGKKEGGFRLQSTLSTKNKQGTGKSSSTSNTQTSGSTTSSSQTISKSGSGSSTSVSVNTNGSNSENTVEVNNDGENTFVYSMSSNSNSTSRGNMNKVINNPQAGTWKVLIDTKNVSGHVLIKIGQSSDN